jgi:hypothetical protein
MSKGDSGDNLVSLSAPRDSQEAHIWRAALEAQGIRCKVVGEQLAAGGLIGWHGEVPEVWVFERDRERALNVISELQQSAGQSEDLANSGQSDEDAGE